MSRVNIVAERFGTFRSVLEGMGAPVWEQRDDPRPLPGALLDRCPLDSQRRDWVDEITQMSFAPGFSLRISFGWALATLDEIEDWRVAGVEYGKDLAADGVVDAWMDDWVPILGHNDGLVVVDRCDRTRRLWWEEGIAVALGVDVVGLLDLLIGLLRDGTYVWNAEFGGFDPGGVAGHPILDSY